MAFKKWQFWAAILFFVFDVLMVFLPVGALIVLLCAFVRPLRLWCADFLLSLEPNKLKTLNELYGEAEEEQNSK